MTETKPAGAPKPVEVPQAAKRLVYCAGGAAALLLAFWSLVALAWVLSSLRRLAG